MSLNVFVLFQVTNEDESNNKSDMNAPITSIHRSHSEEHCRTDNHSRVSGLINAHNDMIAKQSNEEQTNHQGNRTRQIKQNSLPNCTRQRFVPEIVNNSDMNRVQLPGVIQNISPQEQPSNLSSSGKCVNCLVLIPDAIHESIGKFVITKNGTVVFIHGKQDTFKRTFFSLKKMEKGEVKTIIPESSEIINDITLIETDGGQALVVVYGDMLTALGVQNETAERRILNLDSPNSFICAHGKNSVVIVTRVTGPYMNDTHLLIQTVQIAKNKAKLLTCCPTTFDVAGINDICVRRNLLFVCCMKDNYVAAIGISDGGLRWKVEVNSPFGICTGAQSQLYVTLHRNHKIVEIFAQTGILNRDFPIESTVQAPTSVYFSDGFLHVAHVDANKLRLQNKKDWCISQYEDNSHRK